MWKTIAYPLDAVHTIRIKGDVVNRKAPIMNDAEELQSRWPSFAEFASGAGVSTGTAQVWRHRDSIPGRYHFAIATDAARRGLGTFDAILSELAKMKSKVNHK
jgi:hypothetical protein